MTSREGSSAGVWWPPLVASLVTFAVFVPALFGSFVDWDDPEVILTNPHIRQLDRESLAWMFTGVRMGHYQPLTWLSYAVDHALWGLDPFGFRLTNVLLHALNAGLLCALAIALLGRGARVRTWVGSAALVGSLFWALHPLRVESVAWATERRDVLSVALLLGAVMAYLYADRARSAARRASPWIALAVVLHALSLGAKAWGMTLPAVLLVLDAWPLARLGRAAGARRAWGPVLVEKLPFIVLALGAALMALYAQREVGALVTGTTHALTTRVAQGVYGLSFYLERTLIPLGLSPLYELWRDRVPWGEVAARGAALLALGAAAVRFGRAWPAIPAALVAYAILVSPVLGAAQSGPQLVADRYAYLSTIPLALALGAGARALFEDPARRRGAAIGAVALGALLASAAIRQVGHWSHSVALWSRAIEVEPRSSRAWVQLGIALDRKGEAATAMHFYQRAIALRPDFWLAWTLLARLDPSEYPGALDALGRELARTPGQALVHAMRGELQAAAGAYADALVDLDRAVELAPSHAHARYQRGIIRAALGDAEGASADYDAALFLSGGLPVAPAHVYNNRASVRASVGDFEGALADLERALAFDPTYVLPLVNRAAVRMAQGAPQLALADLERACAVEAPPPEAFAGRAELRRAAGDREGAIADLREALRRAPPAWSHRATIEAMLRDLLGS